jgi:hypothetical protein
MDSLQEAQDDIYSVEISIRSGVGRPGADAFRVDAVHFPAPGKDHQH